MTVTVIIVDEEIKDETRSLPVPVAARNSQHFPHSLTTIWWTRSIKGKAKNRFYLYGGQYWSRTALEAGCFFQVFQVVCVLLPLSCAAAPRSPSLRRCCFVFNEQMGSLVASGEGELVQSPDQLQSTPPLALCRMRGHLPGQTDLSSHHTISTSLTSRIRPRLRSRSKPGTTGCNGCVATVGLRDCLHERLVQCLTTLSYHRPIGIRSTDRPRIQKIFVFDATSDAILLAPVAWAAWLCKTADTPQSH